MSGKNLALVLVAAAVVLYLVFRSSGTSTPSVACLLPGTCAPSPTGYAGNGATPAAYGGSAVAPAVSAISAAAANIAKGFTTAGGVNSYTPPSTAPTSSTNYGAGSLGYSSPTIATDALAYESGNYDSTIPIGEGQISPYPNTADYYAAAEGGSLIS